MRSGTCLLYTAHEPATPDAMPRTSRRKRTQSYCSCDRDQNESTNMADHCSQASARNVAASSHPSSTPSRLSARTKSSHPKSSPTPKVWPSSLSSKLDSSVVDVSEVVLWLPG